MITKKQIKERITSNAILIRQYGISKIGLFRSYARQQETKDSDIDILIDFDGDKETFDNFMAICNLLEQLFSEHQVEVVTTNGLSPYIGPYVQIAN